MRRYHIVPQTGKSGVCDPKKTGICKYAENGENPEHYDSPQEAEIAYEKIAAEKLGNISTLPKKKKKSAFPNPDNWEMLDESDEELKTPSESLKVNHGDEHTLEYYQAAYEHYEGIPRIVSRTRVIYMFEDHVIKVPLTDEGEYSNGLEVNVSNQGDIPIAKSEFITINHNGKEIEVMKMEKVQPVNADYDKMPNWIYQIDCGQVGLTRTGELVAYDL